MLSESDIPVHFRILHEVQEMVTSRGVYQLVSCIEDGQVDAFTSLLWDEEKNILTKTRATTPGTLIVPSTKGEEMYSPAIFSPFGSDQVIVE